MSIPARLSFVTIGVRDREKMRAFYMALGWPVGVDVPGELVSFLVGGVVLGLWPIEKLHAEAAPDQPIPSGWNGISLSCNVESSDEVDSAYSTALAAGATPVMAPVDRNWGGRSGYFADPEGNRWEIAWAPGMEFSDRGAVTKFG